MKQDARYHPFWVFVAPTNYWSRLHTSECRHCNNGTGQPGQEKEEPRAATEWHPFDTLAEGIAYMEKRAMRRRKACGTCLPAR